MQAKENIEVIKEDMEVYEVNKNMIINNMQGTQI